MDLIIRYVGYLDTYYNNPQIYEIFRKPQSVYNIFSANEKTANRNERKALTERIAFYDAVLDILTHKSAESASAAEETEVAEPQTKVETTTETTSFTPGLVEDEYTAKLSGKRRKALHDVAVALGLRVRFVDAVRTAAGGLANADISGNEVRIAWSKRDKAISFLVGHEFTHRMQELAPKEYASFKESVKAYMGDERWNALVAKTRSIYEAHNAREMARAEAEHRAPRLLQYSVELIEDEVVADFAGELNEDANALAAFAEKLAEKPSTLKAVIAVLRDILNKLKGLVAGAEAQRLANMLSKFEELYRASASRTTEGKDIEKREENTAEATKNEKPTAEEAKGEETKTDYSLNDEREAAASRIADNFGEVDIKRGDVKYALQDVLPETEVEQAVQDLMRVTGRSRGTVERYLKAEQSLAKFILSGDNAAYLDYEADDSVPSIWENSDYPQGTVEFSNICRKRLPLTMIYQKLQKEFPNTKFNKTQLETIRQTLIANGIDVACGLCFVEDRRQHNDEIGQGFIDALRGKDVYVNANQQKAIDKLRESGDNYIPNLYELLTLDGMKKLRMEHPDVANAFIKYNNARGQQAGRLFQAYSAYHREILKFNNARVKKTNDVGGLRIFSFSDFEAHHLIDLVQVLTDCARKGIKVQGYTKVPEFALAVKDTNMKLNRSLIAKDNGVVEADYSPKKGEAVSPNVIDGKRLLLDTVEGIDVTDKNFFDSSASKNVGNILVGVNDEQIRIAMLDPFVDYIIPFHTGLSADILKQKGISDWKNYKYEQIEKTIVDGKMVNAKTHVNIYTDVLSDDIKTEKQFVERYLEVCKEKNLVPKFARFLNRDKAGNFVYTKGYYKFLLDFKMFDAKGRILPQEVVQPIFNDEVNKQILDDYVKGEKAKSPNEEVYEEVKEALGLGGPTKFSLQTINALSDALSEYNTNGDIASFVDAVSAENARFGGHPYLTNLILDYEEDGNADWFTEHVKRIVAQENGEYAPYTAGGVKYSLSSSNKSAIRYDKENGTNVKEFFDFLRNGKVFEDGKPNLFHIANAGDLLQRYGIKGKFMVGTFTFSRTHTDNEDHKLGLKEWVDVINKINNPLAITSYKGQPNKFRIYTYATINGKNICVGVNVSLKDNVIELSRIISAYGRDINNLLGKESINLLYPSSIEELKQRISQGSTAHNSLLNATSSASGSKDTTSNAEIQTNEQKFSLVTPEMDASYLDAVGRGDMETAQRMVLEAAKRAGYLSDTSYQGSLAFNGAAPVENDYFETKEQRKEAWDNGDYEGTMSLGDYADSSIDTHDLKWQLTDRGNYRRAENYTKESIDNINNALKSDNHKITIYRAVPNNVEEGAVRNGDWVTPSRKYAEYHIGLQDWEGGRIIEQEVDIDHLWWNGDDINEWGYDDGSNYGYRNTPNNRKLLDPVTYDDNGDVIPLSERFNPEKKDIRYSISSQPIFYSNAEYAVRGIKQEKATPEQWLKMIEKNGGLKAGEDKWLGLSDWLKASDKKTLTKDEVLQYIAENDIQIEEVEYAQFGPGLIDEATRKLEAEMREIGIEAMREKYDGFDDLFEVYNGELLWSEERATEGEYEDFIIENNIVDVNAQANAINETRLGYTTNGLDNKREIALTVPTIEPWNTSDNIHFGDAGEGRAVAWIRFGETTDADGKRVLVIDEIQSKRHQEGREKGYRGEIVESYKRRGYKIVRNASDNGWLVFEGDKFIDLVFDRERRGIPSAPFEKNWAELAMKRMLRYAAENGFDKVAWTTGDQQADRYNLSEKVDSIIYKANDNGTYQVSAMVAGRGHNLGNEIPQQELSNYVGKELADRIINSEGYKTSVSVPWPDSPYKFEKTKVEEWNTLSGGDLKIGGEGMKAFYDQMLPSFVRKYAKKWGATVGEVTMPDLEKNNTMHSVDVTPAMRESVMQGQPKFSMRGSDKSLVGLHNISLDKLRKAIKMGGLANPSVAIIDVDKATHEDYGDYTLVLTPNMVDARLGRNAGTWAGDAWTPTYPQVTKRIPMSKDITRFHKDINKMPEAIRNRVRLQWDSFLDGRDANSFAYWYLFEKGVAPEMAVIPPVFPDDIVKMVSEATDGTFNMWQKSDEQKARCEDAYIAYKYGGDRAAYEADLQSRKERLQRALNTTKSQLVVKKAAGDLAALEEFGFDYDAVSTFLREVETDNSRRGQSDVQGTIRLAENYIKDNNLEEDYQSWRDSLEGRYGVKEYIFNGYTDSGNQRWLPHTTANASKWMKKQGREGATGTFPSFGLFVATVIPRMTTLNTIRKRKGHLGRPEQEYEAFKEKWENVYFELGQKLQPDAERFDDYGWWRLIEAVSTNNPKEHIKKQYSIELSAEDMQKLNDMLDAIKSNYPARYFETKFERPVELNEFIAAIVPNDIPADVEASLQEAYLNIYKYDKGVEGSRQEAVLEATDSPNVRFSLRLPKVEYASLSSIIMTRQHTYQKPSFDYAFTAHNFYVYDYLGDGVSIVNFAMPIVGNEEIIDVIYKAIDNGTINSSRSLDTLLEEIQSGKRGYNVNIVNALKKRGWNKNIYISGSSRRGRNTRGVSNVSKSHSGLSPRKRAGGNTDESAYKGVETRLSMPMPDDIFFDDNGDIISFGGDDVREATTIVRRAPKTTEERIKMYIESRHYDSRRVSSGSFI